MDDLAPALTRILDGRWGEVRRRLREHEDPMRFAPPPERLSMEEHRAFTTAQLLSLTGEDFASAGLATGMGGSADFGASVTAFEMLGHGDLSLLVKAGVQFGLFGGAIANLGTERHHTAYLPGMVDGSLLGCFAMTETGHGSNVQHLETTATHDLGTDEIVVRSPTPGSQKNYIGNAARDGRMAAVFAQLVSADGEGHGVHCVLVPIRDGQGHPMPGVTIGDNGAKGGLPGVDNGTLEFDEVRVPRANLLGRYGDIDAGGTYSSPIDDASRRFFTMLGTLVRGRISVAGGAGAATRSALTLATRYALHRRQFAAPGDGEEELTLMSYRAHQRKLLPAIARSYALMLAQNDLVEMMHEVAGHEGGAPEEHQRELEARAAGIKAVATRHATDTIQMCREACGGAGYMASNRLTDLKADTDVFTTFEGDNTVLLQLVAKGLLTEFQETFEDNSPRAMIAFASRFTASSILERTPAAGLISRLMARAPSTDDDDAERHRGRQLSLFLDREKHLLEGVALRLAKAARAEPTDAFRIFNNAQDHLLAAAEAHIDRVLLEAMCAAVETCEEGPVAELLDDVTDLFALSTIERHRAWYLEHGRLTPTASKRVIRGVGVLCKDLAPHARLLVDAFAIPDAWLGAPGLLEPLGSA
ncbi:acyl-CoA dehydrogenase family protein [Knoellia aerolata]|uniref:acyl-CoA oxidase n=1 Tax=Knoellia aerolata DSM 18566 TaxID=1385519 RepID=A0A0A0JV58_9MICO|nr:acyl-CoA dehydrogenase [Knoellia aerolata]KGN40584.1 acyl-CoA oxidase [Knoellia aerolata DSM 18566]